jgi:hypothetical protein
VFVERHSRGCYFNLIKYGSKRRNVQQRAEIAEKSIPDLATGQPISRERSEPTG